MLQRAQQQFPYLANRLATYDGNWLPYADEQFGAIVMFTVLNAIPEQDNLTRLAAQWRRVLRPGGIIYLTEFLQTNSPRGRARYFEYQNTHPQAPYGTFQYNNAIVMRHFTLPELCGLNEPCDVLHAERLKHVSMNGNVCLLASCLLQLA